MKKCDELLPDPKSPPMGVTYLVERGTRPGLNAAQAWSAGALMRPIILKLPADQHAAALEAEAKKMVASSTRNAR